MSTDATTSLASPVLPVWRDPVAWAKTADIFAALIALSLPWGIAIGPWVPYLPLPFPIRLRRLPAIVAAPGDDPREIRDEVRSRMQAALDAMKEESNDDRRGRVGLRGHR